MTTDLKEMQEALLKAVKSGDNAALLPLVEGDATLSAEKRIDIYLGNIASSHEDALAKTFPATKRFLGQVAFRELAKEYSQKYPSSSPNIDLFGNELSDYISKSSFPAYLADLVKLEWTLFDSYGSTLPLKFDFDAFSEIPESKDAEIKFGVTESLRMISCTYPVAKLRADIISGEFEPGEYKEDPCHYVVWKDSLAVNIEEIDHPLSILLQAIIEKHPMSKLAEIALANEVELDNGLSTLIKNGWVDKFIV